jgi:hypothetical protein
VSDRGLEISTATTFSTPDAVVILNARENTHGTLAFQTSSTERMRITSAGNVGIGTSAPEAALQILRDSTSPTGATIQNTNAGSSVRSQVRLNSNAADVNFFASSSTNTAAATGGRAGTGGIFTAAGDTAGGLAFLARNPAGYITMHTGGETERMRLDSSGNLGLGVTPSAWSTGRAFQIGTGPSIWGLTRSIVLGSNSYFDSGDKYLSTGAAGQYTIASTGVHQWFNAPSGTAGNAISFTQAMTLNASGNLGIGTSSPGARLHVRSLNGSGSSGGLVIQEHTNQVHHIYSETSVQQNRIGSSTPTWVWGLLNGAERMRIDSAGTLILNQGQIQFPATQVASANANTLDDYEEGTWTPALKFGGASVSLTSASGFPIGRYTKVGNTVYAYFDIRLTNKGTSTGDMTVEGLPFATSSSGRQGGSLYKFANSVSGAVWESNQLVFVESSATVIKLGYASGGNTVLHTHADVNNFGIYAGLVVYNV